MGKFLKHATKVCELASKQVFLKEESIDLVCVFREIIRLWWIPRDESGSNWSAVVV